MLLLLLGLAAPAQAEPLAPKIIPTGSKIEIEHRGILKCYSLTEYLQLLDADNELDTLRRKTTLLHKEVRNLEETAALRLQLMETLERQKALALNEVLTMTKKWEAENLARHNAESDRTFWMGMAGMSTFVTVALVVTYVGITYREDIFQ